jgi:polysaccharide export outer membrane protein
VLLRFIILVFGFCLAGLPFSATGQLIPTPQAPTAQPQPQQGAQTVQNSVDTLRQTYELAANDQVLIHAPDAEEINDRPFRIDDDGTLTLPLVGAVKAAGMTPQQLEQELNTLLKKYIVNPIVTVTVVQFRSAPVTFQGEFQKPGMYSLQGRHTLVEMLTTVGGTTPTASRRVKVTRKKESGPIPLPGAAEDPGGKTSSVEINLSSLNDINPAEDIELEPYDVISVEKAEQVYTYGAIGKTGGFDVGPKESIPVIQLLSEAGGLSNDAIPEKAQILRPVLNTNRRAIIPINLAEVLATQGTDYPLLPGDVLVVPRKKPHSALASRLGTMALSLIPGIIFALVYNGIL